MIDIRNESCLDTMQKLLPKSIDVVLTSPFYNTNKKAGKARTLENTAGMFQAVTAVVTQTDFTIADVIVWKKSNALPNSCSPNRLTRIWEFVFVFCRKGELKTFRCNKRVTSLRKTGQKAYENISNFIEAKNNDETCLLYTSRCV